MRLRWFITDLPCIDYESPINSRDLNRDRWSAYDLGELPEQESDREYNGQWTRPASATGGKGCHPEWLATGEPWPSDLPPQEYDSADIPVCCGAPIPPPPPYGLTCADAPDLALDQWYTYNAVPAVSEQWFAWESVFSGTVHIETEGFTPGGALVAEFGGTLLCATFIMPTALDPCTTHFLTGATKTALRVLNPSGVAQQFKFKVSLGACP